MAGLAIGLLIVGCGSESGSAAKPDAAAGSTTATLASTTATAAPTTAPAAPTTATMAPTTAEVVSTTAKPASTTATQAGAPAAAPAPKKAVAVKQFQFMPAELVVKPGAAVTWTNEDEILHTATSGATPGTPDGQFDGPMDGRGKSYTNTFTKPGRYPYFCSRHNSMTGTVVVQ